MLKYLVLALLLVTPAAAQQVTPSFGIDSSGTLRNLSVRDPTLNGFVPFGILDTTTHSMVAPTVPVERYGAKGNSNGTTGNGTDDTAAIAACVAGGRVCSLRPGATYRLMSAVDIPSNGGLVGNKTATLYCDPAGINNTVYVLGTAINTRYGSNASCITSRGSSGSELVNVILKDFTIDWGGASGARCCQAIEARFQKNLIIDGLEIKNGSANGIRYAQVLGGRIANNYIHDFSNDTGLEFSGIEGDNDGTLPSSQLLIGGNRISSMIVSQTGYNNTYTDPVLPDGYQPNGIKITKGDRITITNNQIDHTGQGIDAYAVDTIIAGNITNYTLAFGIAVKHTNDNVAVINNTIRNAGVAGIGVSGDPTDKSTSLLISGNSIENVSVDDWTGFTSTLLDSSEAPCIGLYTNVKGAKVIGNKCNPGSATGASYDWRDTSADDNDWINNAPVALGPLGEWDFGSDGTGFQSSVVSGRQQLRRRATGADAVPFTIVNSGTAGVGNFAGMELSATNQLGLRSVIVGTQIKAGQGGHCWIVRTSIGDVAAERTSTCQGFTAGSPSGGIFGDMGVGTINATGIYQNGIGPLGTAAIANTGASGHTLGYLDVSNLWTGSQLFAEAPVVSGAGVNLIGLSAISTDPGAVRGPNIYLSRSSASPSAPDSMGAVVFQGRDLAGNAAEYSTLFSVIDDPTDGSEDGGEIVQNLVAGAPVNVLKIGAGLMLPGTVADPGVGSMHVAGGYQVGITTVAALPACSAGLEGMMRGVSDANSTTYHATAAGGGTNRMPVYCNGTAWVLH